VLHSSSFAGGGNLFNPLTSFKERTPADTTPSVVANISNQPCLVNKETLSSEFKTPCFIVM